MRSRLFRRLETLKSRNIAYQTFIDRIGILDSGSFEDWRIIFIQLYGYLRSSGSDKREKLQPLDRDNLILNILQNASVSFLKNYTNKENESVSPIGSIAIELQTLESMHKAVSILNSRADEFNWTLNEIIHNFASAYYGQISLLNNEAIGFSTSELPAEAQNNIIRSAYDSDENITAKDVLGIRVNDGHYYNRIRKWGH